MVPIYTTETTLLIERQAPQVRNMREVLAESLMTQSVAADRAVRYL